jgi:hypothetical protein
MDLKSSVGDIGEVTTQIIHFIGGEKRTYTNIVSKTIKQGQYTKLTTSDNDRMILVNDKNVLCIEVFKES